MKVLFLKKATLLILIGIICLMSVLPLSVSTLGVGAVYFAVDRKLPIYGVETSENKVSISFDAAWGADKTESIMDICDEYGIKATFFLVGFWIEKYPDMVKTIYNRGFEIGIHSNSHPDMTSLSRQEMYDELSTNINQVEELLGMRPKLFRPPYGYYNNTLIEVCNELGLSCIEWSVDSLDWKGLSASEIAGRIISKVEKGSIILCHNNSDNILPALKLTFEYFLEKKIETVPIGDLIYYDNFIINNNGIQIQNKGETNECRNG